MKRVTLLPSLCFAALLILQGCGSSVPSCTKNVLGPVGTNGQNFVATLLWPCDGFRDTFRVGFDGTVRVPLRCESSCFNIFVLEFHPFFTFSPSPSSIDLLAPPSSATFSGGSGLDTTYGLPRVAYYDGNGTFVGATQVTAVGGDGTWVTATTPDLSQVYSGAYTVQISNMTADGTWQLIGEAIGSAWNRDPPPPPPGGDGGGGDGGGDPGGCSADMACTVF